MSAVIRPHPRHTSGTRPGVHRLELARKRNEERPLYDATLSRAFGNLFIQMLREQGYDAAIAGSLRRGHFKVHDVDILAAHPFPNRTTMLVPDDIQAECIGITETKASFRHPELGVIAEVRFVPIASWGSALQYYTGSRAHNIWLRALARKRGLSLSEYGFRHVGSDGRLGVIMPIRHESEVYKVLGLRWLPPAYRDKPNGGSTH